MQLARFILAGLGIAFYGLAAASEAKSGGAGWGSAGWSGFARGGYVRELNTSLDGGGNFDVDRLFLQGGPSWTSANGTNLSLAFGYARDDYTFSESAMIGGLRPWGDIETIRFSAPLRWSLKENWTGFFLPTMRSTAESGAGASESITGGGFLGFSYRFGPNLTLGPGVGILTQLESDADVFPVLFVDWKITQRLSLETGRGLGATLGPGLQLRFDASQRWDFSLGVRSERLRFRLDRDGPVPNGIGEDKAVPVYVGAAYRVRGYQFAFVGGASLNGKLRLEDETGSGLGQVDYDPSGFFGITFSGRF